MHKTWTVKSTCPQCGVATIQTLSGKEMKGLTQERTLEVVCPECLKKSPHPAANVCAEWDAYCSETPAAHEA